MVTDTLTLLQMQVEIDKLEAKVVSLKKYCQHHPKCYKGWTEDNTIIDCACGLDELLKD